MNFPKYFILSVLLISGCSTIEQPVASIPLVEAQLPDNLAAVSFEISHFLDNGLIGAKKSFGASVMELGKPYFAATGNKCRPAISATKNLLFCKQEDGYWYQIRQVRSDMNSQHERRTQ